MATNRKCSQCKVDCPVDEFFQCCLCKRSAHICLAQFKKVDINADFIRRAALSGFKYICCSCSPAVELFSGTAVNLQKQLDILHTGIAQISGDVSKLSNDVNEIKNIRIESNPLSTNDHAQFSSTCPSTSYASVLKETTLVLTPKNCEIETAELKDKVRKSINPEESRITGFHATSSNKLILKSGNTDTDSFASSMQTKLGQDFEIEIRDNDIKRLKLVRFRNDNFPLDEIAQAIAKQNENEIKSPDKLKIVKEIQCKSDSRFSTLILQVDSLSHKLALAKGFLNIKWSKFKVFDAFSVTRCYKCSRFGHKIADCKAANSVCSKCSGCHESKDCTVAYFTCVNCAEAKSKYNLDIDISHPAYSPKCPTMLSKLQKISRN